MKVSILVLVDVGWEGKYYCLILGNECRFNPCFGGCRLGSMHEKVNDSNK